MNNPGENGGADGADGADTSTQQASAPISFSSRLADAFEALSGRGESAEVARLSQQLAAVTGERDQLLGSIAAAQARITELQNDLAGAQARLSEAEAAVSGFEARVQSATISRVAAAGIPSDELPKVGASGEDPATKLRAQLAETTDPGEKGRIAAQLLALRAGTN